MTLLVEKSESSKYYKFFQMIYLTFIGKSYIFLNVGHSAGVGSTEKPGVGSCLPLPHPSTLLPKRRH